MRKIALSKFEQETIINYNNEEDFATVYTHDVSLIRRLKSKMDDYKEITITREYPEMGFVDFKIPKKWVKIGFPRMLSNKQIEELRQRATKMHEGKARKRDTQVE